MTELIAVKKKGNQRYAPPAGKFRIEFAPWAGKETRWLPDELAMELLLRDPNHFKFVAADHPMQHYQPIPEPEDL